MSDITEEMLMAYADGELSPSERRRVEAYLEANPAAARRVADFVRSGRALARMFDAPMHEPVPERLLATVRSTAPRAGRPANVRSFADRLRDLVQAVSTPWPALAAVSCGLLVAGALGWSLGSTATAPTGTIFASAELRAVLERAPMGVTQKAGTVSVTPVLTFMSKEGAICRQYDRVPAAGEHVSGVVCRQADGQWRIELEAPAAPAGGSSNGYKVAGRVTAPAVEAAVNRLVRGDVLGPDEETKLIGSGWRQVR